ncbi:MAG: DUF1311 domain-containing protein [Hydrogenophilaceae bacterium]|jgi:uncharacterized protein YecT (DUF1311 family)|nr:DUF1311 domain-containing protein [Hydrogenophilaceae bacterium]
MAWSKVKTDLFGKKYIQHYDDRGDKAGTSEFKQDLFGDEYVQHYDDRGDKSGTSEAKRDLFGDEYEQHYNRSGDKAGTSERKRDLFGDEYTQHYDRRGDKAGTSERKRDFFGDEYVEHRGRRGGGGADIIERTRRWRPNSRSDDSDVSNLIWGILAMAAAITIMIVIAIWKYRWVRAAFFLYMAAGLQLGAFATLVSEQGWPFMLAAFAAAALSVPLYRFMVSTLRWRAEPGPRVNAWLVAGVLGAVTLVGDIVLGATNSRLLSQANFAMNESQAPPPYTAPSVSAPPAADGNSISPTGGVETIDPNIMTAPLPADDALAQGLCLQAGTPSAFAICSDPALAALDQEMNEALSTRFAASDRSDLEREQARWVVQRDAACGADTACLARALRDRINALSRPAEVVFESLVGSWSGSVEQLGAPAYELRVTLRVVREGVLNGSVVYPRLNCAGVWNGAGSPTAAGPWTMDEQILEGQMCSARETIQLRRRSDGGIDAYWPASRTRAALYRR